MDIADLSALPGPDLTAENCADLWVVVPDLNAASLLGEARRLADSLGCYVHAIVPDESLSEQAIARGADRVHPAPEAVACLATQQPEFVFFPLAHFAEAARLAQHFRAGLITDARNLSVDDSTRALLGSHPVYGGDYWVDVSTASPVKIATLDPRVYPALYPDPARAGEVLPSAVPVLESRVHDTGLVVYQPQPWRPLTKAKIIVAVGNGIKDAEGFALAEQLAQKLGAEMAADRSGVDFGWGAEDRLVAVTGAEVAPELYIALGIRGDTYHNAAIVGAKQIIAVHANPEASIFTIADYGVVASPKEFLPKLLAALD
jgi:electron transfer flavoprotein alpha subunit